MTKQNSQLFGYSKGAQVLQVPVQELPLDVINQVVFSQVLEHNAMLQLCMTLIVPRTPQPKPAIIYYPGGGFTSSKRDQFIEMRVALAKTGFVVAAVEYRVVPHQFPAPIIDGKAAIRYLRQHAKEFTINPDRIGVLGDSAGGYMAQMMTLAESEEFDQGDFLNQSSAVQAGVSIYGISNLLNIGEGFNDKLQQVHQSPAVTEALLVHGAAFNTFAGASIQSDPDRALYASPMGHIDGAKPPLLLMHGSDDPLVSPIQSQQLYEQLQEREALVDYIIVEKAGHADDDVWYQPAITDTVCQWFKRHLLD
ncbi:alpha/beta hydrolase [Celerinatantimonas diazotrophica]|uniref:Alpha/beta hydrolase family protein n=1 Tax=Celerinatantimonas diazotrophica TaxID=412034 RepID=A0A4R1JLV7_9GAMM|nr:alpha/beta hydrolase [Celerinatantimonas diazotrophica]TCK52026.1 alpha/beta hydrolase family protein [Celerinatantimonas diazotrophica]CAG9296271.1 Acetyl esterase [Celerinatantimonas diazotrophica]